MGDIYNTYSEPRQTIIFGHTAQILEHLSQFDKTNLISAFETANFEYFSIKWDIQRNENEFHQENNNIVYDKIDFSHCGQVNEMDEFDQTMDIVDVKTDFSYQSLGDIYMHCVRWIQSKSKQQSFSVDNTELRLHAVKFDIIFFSASI